MPLPAIAGYLAEAFGTWGVNQLLTRMLPNQNTPYSKSVGANLGYGNQLMPELYAEAMGKPSAATNQTYANVSNEINRLQQSYAASAQRSTPAMTSLSTPVREGQARFGEAKAKAYGDILASGQESARRAIMGEYDRASVGQLALEMQNRQDADSLATMLSDIVGGYKTAKMNANNPLPQWLIDAIKMYQGLLNGNQGLPTPANRNPSGLPDFETLGMGSDKYI